MVSTKFNSEIMKSIPNQSHNISFNFEQLQQMILFDFLVIGILDRKCSGHFINKSKMFYKKNPEMRLAFPDLGILFGGVEIS